MLVLFWNLSLRWGTGKEGGSIKVLCIAKEHRGCGVPGSRPGRSDTRPASMYMKLGAVTGILGPHLETLPRSSIARTAGTDISTPSSFRVKRGLKN